MRQHGASFLAIVVSVLLSIAATVGYSAEAEHWSYSGSAGPAKWGGLEKGFAQCKLGVLSATRAAQPRRSWTPRWYR